MKRAIFFKGCLVIIVGLISACSASGDPLLENGERISTGQAVITESEQKLNNFIEGEWIQTAEEGNIYWKFAKGELKWKEFTHRYEIRNDTLIIAGIPYRVDSTIEDSIRLYCITNRELVALRRK